MLGGSSSPGIASLFRPLARTGLAVVLELRDYTRRQILLADRAALVSLPIDGQTYRRVNLHNPTSLPGFACG